MLFKELFITEIDSRISNALLEQFNDEEDFIVLSLIDKRLIKINIKYTPCCEAPERHCRYKQL